MKAPTPIISIIIPAYNSAKTIEATVESIQCQSIEAFEIIIVDDGSSDNTREVADRIALKDSRIHVYSQENSGVSAARNNGLSRMSLESRYFTFADSDDLLVNDIYTNVLDFMNSEEGKNIDILTFSCTVKDYKGHSKDFVLPEETVSSDETRNVISIDNVKYGGGYIWNRIIRRSFYEENPVKFREDIALYEDKLWLIDLLFHDGKVKMWPIIGYQYFVRERTSNPQDYLEYMIGLRTIVDCDGLDGKYDLERKIRYAESFSKALDYATKENHREMLGLLDEWFKGETDEFQKLLAITHKRLSVEEVSYCKFGDEYLDKNPAQAYLCYENAVFDGEEGAQDKFNTLKNQLGMPRNVSIVILSYNTLEKTKLCIESIRKTTPESAVEIVVVDNNSKDGSLDWLRSQRDIVLVENRENRGFPGGCNDGINASNPDNDIFLLNSDTIVTENALFTLRMGLYSSEEIGSAGCVANNAVEAQKVKESFGSVDEYLDFAVKRNVIRNNAIEFKNWLMGFALIIKREVLEKTGYLDERYNPGNYEDDDLGLRIGLNGYKNALCHNSFIYHFGSESFKSNQGMQVYNSLTHQNFAKYKEKWGYEPVYFTHIREDLAELIDKTGEDEFKVLEIGCMGGNTLSRIMYKFPRAKVCGTETDRIGAKLANLKFPCQNVDKYTSISFSESFDVIIMDETLSKVENPAELLSKCKDKLAAGGQVICSISNSRYEGNASCVHPMDYEEVLKIINEAGLEIKGDVMFISDESLDTDNIHDKIIQYIVKCI